MYCAVCFVNYRFDYGFDLFVVEELISPNPVLLDYCVDGLCHLS